MRVTLPRLGQIYYDFDDSRILQCTPILTCYMINCFWSFPHLFFHNAIALPVLKFSFKLVINSKCFPLSQSKSHYFKSLTIHIDNKIYETGPIILGKSVTTFDYSNHLYNQFAVEQYMSWTSFWLRLILSFSHSLSLSFPSVFVLYIQHFISNITLFQEINTYIHRIILT